MRYLLNRYYIHVICQLMWREHAEESWKNCRWRDDSSQHPGWRHQKRIQMPARWLWKLGFWWKNFDVFHLFDLWQGGVISWCRHFSAGEFFKSKVWVDLHREIPSLLTIHYRVVGYANSNTPWVPQNGRKSHQVDLHVTYVPLSAPVNFSNARRGWKSWVVRDLMFELKFLKQDNWQPEQVVAFLNSFCWMLTTTNLELQDDLLYRSE